MQIETTEGIALIRLNGGKANAMDRAFLERLGELLEALGHARAVVLTGYDRFFSAGLDLPALMELDRTSLGSFIELFSDIMLRVLTLPMPVVAAINGHAIAGGCVLALQADHRLMVGAVGPGIGWTGTICPTTSSRGCAAPARPPRMPTCT
jgi:enoyl-CoA hydratase/carnithine racemase